MSTLVLKSDKGSEWIRLRFGGATVRLQTNKKARVTIDAPSEVQIDRGPREGEFHFAPLGKNGRTNNPVRNAWAD
jgi:hypothetical protein